jgi:hypothetical protein
MLQQMTLMDLTNAISSPVSADGLTPCNSPDGLAQFGQVLAPASHSAAPASSEAKPTRAISGRISIGSSASVALSQCLASKLQAQLGTVGSMEYAQIWKRKVTPAGRVYWAHTASKLRTSGSGCTGWPTPDKSAGDGGRQSSNPGQKIRPSGTKQQLTINDAAQLAGWPSPTVLDTMERSGMRPSREATGRTTGYLSEMAGMAETGINPDGTTRERLDQLPRQVTLGQTPSGSPAETGKAGALNPAFPCWLMGFPPEWCQAAIAASRKLKPHRKRG